MANNKYRSIVKLDFQYAHRFMNYPGEASYLHGHSGLLTIEGITQTATCTLLDATGRIVATRSLQASPMQQIELPALAKGAYIIKVNAAGQEGSRLFMVAN